MSYYKSMAVLSCVFSSALLILPTAYAADMGRISHTPQPEVSDMSRVSNESQQEKLDMGRLSQATPAQILNQRPVKIVTHSRQTQKYRG